MKKFLLTLMMGVMVVAVASAQDFSSGRFGIRAGLNVSNGVMKFGGIKANLDPKVGFHLGLSYELPIPSNLPLSIETGLYASLKGWNMNGSDWDFGDEDLDDWDDDSYDSGKVKTTLFYLQLPILIGYRYSITNNISLKPFAGMYFAYAVSGKEKMGDYKLDLLKKDEDGYQAMKRGDMGLRFGVSADISDRYNVGLGYDMGLMNIAKESEGGKLKNRCFTLSVGYNF